MERVLASENLRKAWHQVKANHGAAGVDGMTIEAFPACARAHWASIRQALRDETYQPSPVRRTEIPKRHGQGTRLLGIPTVVDRVLQQAIAQGLGPILDPGFSASSFGFRPGRSAHQAVKPIQSSSKMGYRVAVDRDLAKFFDRVNHDALLARGARKVRDKALLRVIGKYRRAGVLVGECLQPTEEGVPQGSPLTPPTMLRTASLRTQHERVSTDAKHYRYFLFVNLDPTHQGPNNLPLRLPIGRDEAPLHLSHEFL
jgi:RNA-directed DNA polymerase